MSGTESPSKALALSLAKRIGIDDERWMDDLLELFARQNESTLNRLLVQSEELPELALQALDLTISDYLYSFKPKDNSAGESNPIPQDEFFLRAAFSVIDISVEYHQSMIGQVHQHYNGDTEELSEDDLYQSVSNTIHSLVANLSPNERSLKLVRGIYLFEDNSGGDDLPSDDELMWLGQNAMLIAKHPDRSFKEGFDRAYIEELLKVTPSLREGVL